MGGQESTRQRFGTVPAPASCPSWYGPGFSIDGAPLDPLAFADSLEKPEPPPGMSLALQGLWWDAKGDWERAHACAQQREDAQGMRLHAYLHRKEGDQSNAEYWYRRCGAAPSTLTLDQEWEELVRTFLGQA